jgi:hypothetical protein
VIRCLGDNNNCGGTGYNLFHNAFVAVQGPKQPSESDKSYRGCYADTSIVGNRSPAHENVDTCRAHCKGFRYFGIAAGKYCDCSNEILAPQGIETRFPDYLCKLSASFQDLAHRMLIAHGWLRSCSGASPCDTKTDQMCGGNAYGTFYQSVYMVYVLKAVERVPAGTELCMFTSIGKGLSSRSLLRKLLLPALAVCQPLQEAQFRLDQLLWVMRCNCWLPLLHPPALSLRQRKVPESRTCQA